MKEALRTEWNLHTSRWVLSPDTSRFVQHWDVVAAFAMLYVAIVSPVQVAMMEANLDVLFFVNCFVDLVFVVDMILRFFMMYSVQTNFGHKLEHRHGRIVLHYLKTWFLIDLFSVLPFDLVALILKSETVQKAKSVKFIRLLRLLKMTRMLKASRIYSRLEAHLMISYEGLALNKFFFLLILISHWLACTWALTLTLTEDEGLPRWVDTV